MVWEDEEGRPPVPGDGMQTSARSSRGPPRQLCCLLDGMARGYVVAGDDVGTEVLPLSKEGR